jgi:ribosomal protein L37E
MLNLQPNQAIECEKCGHLTFEPQWIVTVCMHCKIPLNEKTQSNDSNHMFLCKKCSSVAKEKESEFATWNKEFYHDQCR